MPYWDERVAEKAKEFTDVKVEKYHVSSTKNPVRIA
jgi:tartrate dehydrogenase/decarboxylase / D-malate dehydrogenase